jgi:hypothetical protein
VAVGHVYCQVNFVGYVEGSSEVEEWGEGVCGNVMWITALFVVILLTYITL